MEMKKTNLATAISALLLLSGVGVLSYVYFKDTGVSYGGRARLDYNWTFLTADRPSFEYKYDGQFFSFSYLTGKRDNQVRDFTKAEGGYLFGDLFDLDWFNTVPAEIRPELTAVISGVGGVPGTLSGPLLEWLTGEKEMFFTDNIERIKLTDGVAAAVISVKAKDCGLCGNYRYLVAEKNGLVVKIKNLAGASVNEEQYRQFRFEGLEVRSSGKAIKPDGARDRLSLRVFSRLMETFRFSGK